MVAAYNWVSAEATPLEQLVSTAQPVSAQLEAPDDPQAAIMFGAHPNVIDWAKSYLEVFGT